MVELYDQTQGNVIAVQECAPDQTHKYGIVGVGDAVGEGFKITEMVEKPAKGTAPSNFYINGRYISARDFRHSRKSGAWCRQ